MNDIDFGYQRDTTKLDLRDAVENVHDAKEDDRCSIHRSQLKLQVPVRHSGATYLIHNGSSNSGRADELGDTKA